MEETQIPVVVYARVVDTLTVAKRVVGDVLKCYPDDHPEAVANVALLIQNEMALDVHRESLALAKTNYELSAAVSESSIGTNLAVRELADVQIKMFETGDDSGPTVGPVAEGDECQCVSATRINDISKSVSYFTIKEFIVPFWAKWIATDLDGRIWVYNNVPICSPAGVWTEPLGKTQRVGTMVNIDWKMSLREIVD